MFSLRTLALAALAVGLASFIGGAAVFQYPGAAVPRAAGSEGNTTQTIAVSGESTLYAEPDMATVQLGVQTNATTAQEAQQKNANQMSKVIDRLQGIGIDRKDIRTSSVSLFPTYDRQYGNSNTPNGYQASNSVSVVVRDLKKVSDVLDGAVAAGANTAGGVSFGIQDDSSLRQQALAKAVENARPKADAMAKAIGVKISGVQSITEEGVSVPRPLDVRAAPAAGSEASTPVMPGQLTIVGRVTIIYTY